MEICRTASDKFRFLPNLLTMYICFHVYFNYYIDIYMLINTYYRYLGENNQNSLILSLMRLLFNLLLFQIFS